MKRYFFLTIAAIFISIILIVYNVNILAEEPEIDSSGLVAHYSFDGSLADKIGNFADGKDISKLIGEEGGNITYSEGISGQAAVFDGASGVRLPAGLISSDIYSVSIWLNPKQLTAYTTSFFAAKANNQWVSLVPKGVDNNTMVWSGEEWYDGKTGLTIKIDKWSHLVFIVNKGNLNVYVNGQKMFSGTGFPDYFSMSQGIFTLGVNWWDPAFKGLMDELRIYDIALTEEQVTELMKEAPKKIVEDFAKQQAKSVPIIPDQSKFSNVTVHDPSVIKVDDTYYVFGSHLAAAKSRDLLHWTQISTSPRKGNKLVPDPAQEFAEALKWAQTNTFWAPDVIQLGDGRFYMYYCNCEGSSPRANIGIAVSDNIEGPYQDLGMILKSGMWNEQSEDGTIYDATKHPNAVDPDVFFDRDGKLWMVYGSYSGGIFIIKMNPKTGFPYPDQGYGRKLLGGNHSRIEGPYILYSPETKYYYLFLSYGGLAYNGGYNIRVARSKQPYGPFYDAVGNKMIDAHGPVGSFFDDQAIEPYGVKLIGNFHILDEEENPTGIAYVSPGHNSAFYDQKQDKYFIFFHSRFPFRGEQHEVRVHQMFINDKGWPVITPHRYTGETIEKYAVEEIIGKYAFVNHGKDITAKIKDSVVIKLNKDGSISGSVNGQWQKTSNYDIELTIDGVSYDGVLLRQWDNGLQKYVMTFSALSVKDNIAIWGSQLSN